MSLVDQSQQWFPTSVRVTVHQAKDLRVKGKNGTNDAYAIIQLAKDKFSTCVAEKCVVPVWKEEASFDLPLFHPGNAERCTLYVIVMHRAQVGLDKFLGQAVVNLLALHDNQAHKSTDWFKLVDKSGKEDKARGEVLLDIQFMRNNMSASMFDLSMQDKPRSRISKLKDKVRGKKKDGFSDSASAIVPSVSQVLTDSEGEADAVSLNQTPGEKKKSKLKTLFAPKSNLQRNVSQSMSTLGTLPEKNSSLSSSRSSGLNIDSPGVKKKFKFLGHKRTGSSDSKGSQGPFSILGRSKQSDLNNMCINGSHVYAEEAETKSGSTISLNSSGQGSVEDVNKQTLDLPADTFKSVPLPSNNQSTDRALLEQQRHQEEQRQIAEAKRLEEEEKKAEALRLQQEEERCFQQEQDRKKRLVEDEARRKKQKEEEEMRRKQEDERRKQEAAENEKREEERRQEELRRQEQALKAEEQKRQEEASMSERLTSLFGMIRKKEEKKEDVAQQVKEELPTPAPRQSSDQGLPVSHQSKNPFEEIPLSSDLAVSSNENPAEAKPSHNPPNPSAMVFLNRTAKVSAVKPRLTVSETLKSDPTDCQTSSQQCPSPPAAESTLSSAPPEPSDSFQTLHSSLAPQNRSLSNSPSGSLENLSSVEDSENMAEKKRKAPPPPSSVVNGMHTRGREILNPAYVEPDTPQQNQKKSLPLPDYETLFPQKRHGVQGHTRWDHIIAEVNQKQRNSHVELSGKEMSVDCPEEQEAKLPWESSTVRQTHPQVPKPVSSKNVAAPAPPKPESSQRQTLNQTRSSYLSSDPSPLQKPVSTDRAIMESLMSRNGARKALQPPATVLQAPKPKSEIDPDSSPQSIQRNILTSANKDAPMAKPRQRVSGKEPVLQEECEIAPDRNTVSDSNVNIREKTDRHTAENFAQFDPFPNNELLSKDPWEQTKHNHDVDNFFSANLQKEKKPEEQGMAADDLDNIFSSGKTTDPFTVLNGTDSYEDTEYRNKSLPPQHQTDHKTQNYSIKDTFGADPFTIPSLSLMASSEPLPVVMEEPAAGGLAGGKTPLRAWVSPSEGQPVSAQNSSGGGLALTQRRPHAVKPLSPADSLQPTSTSAFKEIKVHSSAPAKNKVSGSPKSGPYTQLTQDELITLVVKQQADLSKKDAKIGELEEYIDNLLVRVIEEKPTILQSLNAAKPV